MKYLPNGGDELRDMLTAIGVDSVEELLKSIPEGLRLTRPLNIPEPQSEIEVWRELKRLAQMNGSVEEYTSFLGAGAYSHYIPTVVSSLISRSEFYTAYTPYQPEVSQGTLQALFEYQTMIARLTGMEVANSSLYDGASATAEALLMSERITKKRKKFVLSSALHPEYVETVETYFHNLPFEIVAVELSEDGTTDIERLQETIDEDTSAVVVQYPNFFGCVENLDQISKAAHDAGALFIVVISEIYSLGLLEGPGAFGADIVVGEARSFGNRLMYGGPYLGLVATKKEYLRQMPGRLVGETKDNRGQRGYVVTLSTREQHIRREKATSNICTNVALCATMAAIHMSCFGEEGIREAAMQNLSKAHYAYNLLNNMERVTVPFSAPFFNEFVIDVHVDVPALLEKLTEKGIIAGFPLGWYYPDRNTQLLVAVTEMNTKEEIDRFAEVLGGVL